MKLAALAKCAALIALVLIAGCSATSMRDATVEGPLRKPERLLLAGIKQYEDGQLTAAKASLQGALADGLLYNVDRVTAHKYLAFIACATNEPQQCREQFAAALALDPSFELSRAEAGHPLWGPVFRSVKTAMTPAR